MKPKIHKFNFYFLIIVSYVFLSINISLSPFNIIFLNETFALSKESKAEDTKESKAEKKRIKDEKKAEKKRIKTEKKAEKAIAKKDKDKSLTELKIIFENNEISKIERDKKIKEIIETYLQKIKIINSNYK